MKPHIISIDVGMTGGFATFAESGHLITCQKMPIIKFKLNGKTKSHINVRAVVDAMKNCNIAVIENQWGFPGQSSQSVFSLGKSFGVLTALAESLELELVLVNAKVWKKSYPDITKFKLRNEQKLAGVRTVNELYGLKLKNSDDGIADAVLIGRHFLKNHNS